MHQLLRRLSFVVGLLLTACAARHNPQPLPPPPDNAQLAALYRTDQDDRQNPALDQQALEALAARDRARERKVLELYRNGALHTGTDYYHAAMVLQHSQEPAKTLLAHELSVAAAFLGEQQARWLAAASEDRYLLSIGQPQRFGTQFRVTATGQNELRLPLAPEVTHSLRALFEVRPLPSSVAAQALKPLNEDEPMNEAARRTELAAWQTVAKLFDEKALLASLSLYWLISVMKMPEVQACDLPDSKLAELGTQRGQVHALAQTAGSERWRKLLATLPLEETDPQIAVLLTGCMNPSSSHIVRTKVVGERAARWGVLLLDDLTPEDVAGTDSILHSILPQTLSPELLAKARDALLLKSYLSARGALKAMLAQ